MQNNQTFNNNYKNLFTKMKLYIFKSFNDKCSIITVFNIYIIMFRKYENSSPKKMNRNISNLYYATL